MVFQVSPGISVTEIDQSTVVPTVATTAGAFAGNFRWGPVEEITLVTSENDLVSRFGRPKTGYNIENWFTAANFLSYSNQLYVVRAANTSSSNTSLATYSAFAKTDSVNSAIYTVRNEDHYDTITFSNDTDLLYVAKYPGELGNSLKVSVCDTAAQFSSNVVLTTEESSAFDSASTKLTIAVGANTGSVALTGANTAANNTTAAGNIAAKFTVGDIVEISNTTIGTQYLKVSAVSAVTMSGSNNENASFTLSFESLYRLSVDFDSADNANTVSRKWEYFNSVDTAPGQSAYVAASGNTSASDELHLVVVDEDGEFSGTPGTVLEVFQGLSRATDAKADNGATIYYKNVLNNQSQYLWWANDRSGAASATAVNIADSSATTPLSLSFADGQDGPSEYSGTAGIDAVSYSSLVRGYDKFASKENADISLIIAGKARGTNNTQLANYIIDNIAEVRKDCVVFVSPDKNDVINAFGAEATNIVEFRNNLRSTSYGVLDSGYKYQYDKYNDVFHYVPLNGDVAGLCAFTDLNRDPWFSPAGFSRGAIRNVVRLAFNPNQTERDVLYKNGINPVVTFPGQGTVLFGDKTLLNKASAFDRINVRRLFIVLEETISNAAQSALFEFNDEFTRAQFKNLIEPFLRDVQGRRGITDFRVVCDESNNTAQVIDSNSFVGDIYVRPNKAINFIRLNFIAVRSGVEFTEISG